MPHAGRPPLHVILLGTNHFTAQPAACLSGAGAWATPLGPVPVDAELTRDLEAAGLPVDDGVFALWMTGPTGAGPPAGVTLLRPQQHCWQCCCCCSVVAVSLTAPLQPLARKLG